MGGSIKQLQSQIEAGSIIFRETNGLPSSVVFRRDAYVALLDGVMLESQDLNNLVAQINARSAFQVANQPVWKVWTRPQSESAAGNGVKLVQLREKIEEGGVAVFGEASAPLGVLRKQNDGFYGGRVLSSEVQARTFDGLVSEVEKVADLLTTDSVWRPGSLRKR